MAVVAQPYADVNGLRITTPPNKDLKNKDGTDRTWFDHVIQFGKDVPFRFLQSLDRLCRIAAYILKEMGHEMAGFFEGLSSKLGFAWAALAIPLLPEKAKTAWKAIAEWGTPNPKAAVDSPNRATISRMHDLFDAAATWLYAGSIVLGNSALKAIADIPDLFSNLTDLVTATEDYNLATSHESQVSGLEVKRRLADTASDALKRIIKATASIASAMLGFIAAGLLTPGVSLALGCISTAAAVSAYFGEKMAPYEKVKYFG